MLATPRFGSERRAAQLRDARVQPVQEFKDHQIVDTAAQGLVELLLCAQNLKVALVGIGLFQPIERSLEFGLGGLFGAQRNCTAARASSAARTL
jgi:hypothetical protein